MKSNKIRKLVAEYLNTQWVDELKISEKLRIAEDLADILCIKKENAGPALGEKAKYETVVTHRLYNKTYAVTEYETARIYHNSYPLSRKEFYSFLQANEIDFNDVLNIQTGTNF